MQNPSAHAPASSGSAPLEKQQDSTWLKASLPVLSLFAASILVYFLYCGHMVSGLVNPDAMDFAQLGRNLIQGHGLVTHILHPLALTHGSDPTRQPDLLHGPLYPFVLALGFGMFGVKDQIVLATSGLFYALTVPLLYLLGRRLFDARVGMVAALIFLLNGEILDYATSGTQITLFMFLATCLFFTLHKISSAAHRPSARSAETASEPDAALPKTQYILAGILSGLLYLTDPIFLFLLPVVVAAVVMARPDRRPAALGWCLTPMLLLMAPFMLRFGHLTGNPFFGLRGAEMWMGTESVPGLMGYRIAPDKVGAISDLWHPVLRKISLAVGDEIAALPRMPGNWILFFLCPSLFYQYSNPSSTRLRNVLMWGLVAMIVGNLFFSPFPMRLMVVFPVLLVFAVAFLIHTMRATRMEPTRIWAVSAVLGIVLLWPLMGNVVKTHRPAAVAEAAVAKAFGKETAPDAVSFSDQPWVVAWYADRASIWIPSDDTNISDLRKQFPQTRWLFLTNRTPNLSPEWDMTYRGLLGWSKQYLSAERTNSDLPPSLSISGQQMPLLKALEGFTILPPLEKGVPTTVVAAAPAAMREAELPGKEVR